MAHITDGKIGFSLSKVGSTPENTIGDQALANDMNRYVYVKADGSGVSANTVVKITSDFVSTEQANGNFKTTVAIPADNYGWVYEIVSGVQA